MNDMSTKVREKRQESHQRLAEIVEEAKAEVIRIKAYDDLLGEKTLEAAFPAPFALPSRTVDPTSASSEETSEPSQKEKEDPPRPKPRGRRGAPSGKMTMEQVVRRVLEENPNVWLKAAEFPVEAGNIGLQPPKIQPLYILLRQLRQKGVEWLRVHRRKRLVWYSLAPSHGGGAPKDLEAR